MKVGEFSIFFHHKTKPQEAALLLSNFLNHYFKYEKPVIISLSSIEKIPKGEFGQGYECKIRSLPESINDIRKSVIRYFMGEGMIASKKGKVSKVSGIVYKTTHKNNTHKET